MGDVELHEAPLNDRAAEVMLRMELRRAVVNADEAEAAAEQVDSQHAVAELRTRLGRILARRQRLHDSEIEAARAQAAEEVASARRRAEEILAGRVDGSASVPVRPDDEGEGRDPASGRGPDEPRDPDIEIHESSPAPAVAAPDEADEADEPVENTSTESTGAAHEEALIESPATVEDDNPSSVSTALPAPSVDGDREVALVHLIASLSTAHVSSPEPPVPPPPTAPAARRLPLRPGSALPRPVPSTVVLPAEPTGSATDAIAHRLATPEAPERIASERIESDPRTTSPWEHSDPDSVEIVGGNSDDLVIVPFDLDPVALGALATQVGVENVGGISEDRVDERKHEPLPADAVATTIDAEVLANALAKALAPLIQNQQQQRPNGPPAGYYRVVEPPARESFWSTAKHVDLALLAVVLFVLLGILAAWVV